MDLLSKICIVEKNIAILVFRIIHKYYTDIVNKQYHELYGRPDPDKIAGCYNPDIGFQFNYRPIGRTSFFPKIFNIYKGVDLLGNIPLRYQFSSGKHYFYGFR